jgi:hypothetical protein
MGKAIFRETIEICDRAFQTLETKIPAPIRVPHGDDFVFRYKDHIPEVVAIQKLSRISTGLKGLGQRRTAPTSSSNGKKMSL